MDHAENKPMTARDWVVVFGGSTVAGIVICVLVALFVPAPRTFADDAPLPQREATSTPAETDTTDNADVREGEQQEE